MSFIEAVKRKSKTRTERQIVLPEGMDKRTYEAAEQIIKEDFADIIILATDEELANIWKWL